MAKAGGDQSHGRPAGDAFPNLSRAGAQRLLEATYAHLRRRRERLAELVRSEAERIHQLEQGPAIAFVKEPDGRGTLHLGDTVAQEQRAGEIRERLEAFASRRIGRGRPPAYLAEVDKLAATVAHTFDAHAEYLRGQHPAKHRRLWELLLRDWWQTLRESYPPEVRPTRPLPAAVLDAVMAARSPQAAALEFVAAAMGRSTDPESLRTSLARFRRKNRLL